MNLLNEKIRILQTQLSVEMDKKTPNPQNIQMLKKELDKCLKVMNDEC